ncbi:aminotransferase class I/II-fold pyridoxal phosphate-dependent enzyme [Salisediminibacterium beveridgei]|uniref:Arginine decarboxylase / Lysine decarboxylase n=1 Tax=Salisediminibacterium beveridgei TaxID=632773 RepID=A0A1D7R067_9BACI|nr:aminotransferase class I/II-fold pyridoxal phosphate-dependent enzyme [Salisediminibacterium beveridgei]AOM84642.1 Arginine decarboxylase / Lysine decarboxylase [Salisediminibacterium beveridgei]
MIQLLHEVRYNEGQNPSDREESELKHNRRPLIEALQQHNQSSPTSFHVPGHKNGRLFQRGLETLRSAGEWDQTEIRGLDDLYDPRGPLKEAQELLSDLYGSRESIFLTGGSTAGNLIMLYLASLEGKKVLIQRNSHQSILHGLELFGLTGVYVEVDKEQVTGVPLGVSKETLTTALEDHPDTVMVIFTHPTYEGYAGPLKTLMDLVRARGMISAVDEAHGAHFMSPALPDHAISAGADIVVQSAHKMLPALTMGAWLHLGKTAPWHSEKVRRVSQMLQSSSPSYLIMASLDAARSTLACLDKHVITDQISEYQKLVRQLTEESAATVMPENLGEYRRDPYKLPIVSSEEMKAAVWKAQLEKRFAYPELQGARHVLLTMPLFEGNRETVFLQSHAVDIFGKMNETADPLPFRVSPTEEQWTWVSEETSFLHTTFRVAMEKAAGMTSAETITPYPPGIPVVRTGTRITQTHIENLLAAHRSGVAFQTGDRWIHEGVLVYRPTEGDDDQ